ncbi:MAG TPA: hypothetical protein VEK73_07955 [Xanthobacteraceae bacterium]|nr:hypothetical protein [Xanthobacteraceae bacterium]
MICKPLRYAPLAAAAFAAVLVGTVPAAADCRSELAASQQSLERTRAGVAAAAASPDAAKCAADRRYYAALIKVREVFSRCDPGTKKAERAAQLQAAIDDFKAKMPPGCRP